MDVHTWMQNETTTDVRFARVDAHARPSLLELVLSLSSPVSPAPRPLPSLYYIHGKTSYFYDDTHTSSRITQYLEKVASSKPNQLRTIEEAKTFANIPLEDGGKVNRVAVIGVFTDLDVQDEEMEDFLHYFKHYSRFSTRVYTAVVVGGGEVVDWMKSQGEAVSVASCLMLFYMIS